MTHESVLQTLLDRGWRYEDLEVSAEIRAHLTECDACREALGDYDRIRDVLEPAGNADREDEFVEAALPRLQGGIGAYGARRTIWSRWRLGAAIAAAIAMLVSGYAIARFGAPAGKSPQISYERDPVLLPADVQTQAAMFAQLSTMFDNRAAWVYLTKQDSGFGLSATPLPNSAKLVLVRLTLTRNGVVATQTDLAIVVGQKARIDVPAPDGQTLSYQVSVSASQPDQIAIFAEIGKSAAANVFAAEAMGASVSVHPNRAISVGRLRGEGGDFELKVGFNGSKNDSQAG